MTRFSDALSGIVRYFALTCLAFADNPNFTVWLDIYSDMVSELPFKFCLLD